MLDEILRLKPRQNPTPPVDHELTEVGRQILSLCDGSRTVAEIAARLAAERNAAPAAAREDVAAFVAQMAEMRLLLI